MLCDPRFWALGRVPVCEGAHHFDDASPIAGRESTAHVSRMACDRDGSYATTMIRITRRRLLYIFARDDKTMREFLNFPQFCPNAPSHQPAGQVFLRRSSAAKLGVTNFTPQRQLFVKFLNVTRKTVKPAKKNTIQPQVTAPREDSAMHASVISSWLGRLAGLMALVIAVHPAARGENLPI